MAFFPFFDQAYWMDRICGRKLAIPRARSARAAGSLDRARSARALRERSLRLRRRRCAASSLTAVPTILNLPKKRDFIPMGLEGHPQTESHQPSARVDPAQPPALRAHARSARPSGVDRGTTDVGGSHCLGCVPVATPSGRDSSGRG